MHKNGVYSVVIMSFKSDNNKLFCICFPRKKKTNLDLSLLDKGGDDNIFP